MLYTFEHVPHCRGSVWNFSSSSNSVETFLHLPEWSLESDVYGEDNESTVRYAVIFCSAHILNLGTLVFQLIQFSMGCFSDEVGPIDQWFNLNGAVRCTKFRGSSTGNKVLAHYLKCILYGIIPICIFWLIILTKCMQSIYISQLNLVSGMRCTIDGTLFCRNSQNRFGEVNGILLCSVLFDYFNNEILTN